MNWLVNDRKHKTVDYFATEAEALRFASDLMEDHNYDIVVAEVKKELKK